MAVLYDTLGNALYPARPTGSFFANINFTTGAGTAGQAFFFFRVPAAVALSAHVRNIRGRVTWAGTAVAAASYGVDMVRFTSAADIATTGTAVPRVKKASAYAASVITDANLTQKDTVLTTTGATIDASPFNVVVVPASVTGTVAGFDLDLIASGLDREALIFAPTEGFLLRVAVAAHTAGVRVAGAVEWDERA